MISGTRSSLDKGTAAQVDADVLGDAGRTGSKRDGERRACSAGHASGALVHNVRGRTYGRARERVVIEKLFRRICRVDDFPPVFPSAGLLRKRNVDTPLCRFAPGG